SATITLSAPVTLSGLACSPSILNSNGLSTCTVTLSKAPASNTAVSVQSNNASLTVPASVTVSSGQTAARFSATAGTLTADGTATVTATLNGVSRTATITLSTLPALSAVGCSPSTLNSNGSSTCTVTLSKTAAVDTAVSLTDSSASLTIPTSVTV